MLFYVATWYHILWGQPFYRNDDRNCSQWDLSSHVCYADSDFSAKNHTKMTYCSIWSKQLLTLSKHSKQGGIFKINKQITINIPATWPAVNGHLACGQQSVAFRVHVGTSTGAQWTVIGHQARSLLHLSVPTYTLLCYPHHLTPPKLLSWSGNNSSITLTASEW